MTLSPSHSAVAPALGYYYQAIYALRLLLLEDDSSASISIESWDDVVLEKGAARELHQLKHTIDLSKTIGLKTPGLWRTLTVWLDYTKVQDTSHSRFFLATVATLQKGSLLDCLRDSSADRTALCAALNAEAERVLEEREQAKAAKKLPNEWPYADRWKDCARYLAATPAERLELLKRASLLPGSFSIDTAQQELGKILARSFPAMIIVELTKQLLAWWDREVLESLTRERKVPLQADEVRLFITKLGASLIDNGFFEDTQTHLVTLEPPAAGVAHQLDFINASESQRNRSTQMEMRARAQRSAWMKADVTKIEALRKYDTELIEEWSYRFDLRADEYRDADHVIKARSGRELLNWSHLNAPLEVRRIDANYHNPDLIRGTYVYLSGDGSVGWHPDYLTLLQGVNAKSKGSK